ncbi:MAG: UvrD-helicase domain-containing protein [Bacteroidia bacterium]
MLTIYKSSAGSGKTYTLVLEYLKIVIVEPLAYRHVLAVTFTNKATEEMKVRIIETLSRLATHADADLQNDTVWQTLRNYLKEKGKAELSVSLQARKVLELILNDYSNFSVSTIESFFQRIVRAFARELNIPLGYDVEMKQDLVLQRVVADLLMDAGSRPALTRLLEGFIERNLEEEKNWNIDMEIKALGTEIFKERFQTLAVNFPEEKERLTHTLDLVKDLLEIRFKFENSFSALAAETRDIIDRHSLDITDFAFGKSGPIGYMLRFLKKVEPKSYEPTTRSLAVNEDPNKWISAKNQRKSLVESAVQEGIAMILARMVSLYEKGFTDYNTAIQVLRTVHSFGLLGELQAKLADYRKENAQLIISDTTFLLRSVVGDQYDAPFIYEKVGARYRHYLVDEFQDTSDMQWYNLLPLIREALAQGQNSLIVGDVKQSIYRWRNGNLKLLLGAVEAEMKESGQEVEVRNLADNYRTAAAIVEFNNRFFQEAENLFQEEYKAAGDFIFREAYHSVAQNPKKTQTPGLVSVEFFADPDKKSDENEDEAVEKSGWQDQSMKRTLEVILQLSEDGFKGGDVTILVRSNSEGMKLAAFLQQSGVKVISAESLLVVSNQKVLLLQALLQHLNHEQDEIVKASLAYYYSRVVLDEKETNSLFANSEFISFSDSFNADKEELRRLSVYECTERLIRLFPVLSSPDAYVQGFMDVVLEYTATSDASISGFLEWWTEIRGKRAIASAPEPEAVQIMTIHKAKGLEFPIVIIPFADWKLDPGLKDVLWVKPEMVPYNRVPYLPVRVSSRLELTFFASDYAEEKLATHLDNLNLLYVAFTRPVHRLYVFSRINEKGAPLSTAGILIRDLLYRCGSEDLWNSDQNRFTIGSPQKLTSPAGREISGSLQLLPVSFPLINLSDDIRIRYRSNRFLNTSVVSQREKMSAGELVHEALALVHTVEDIEAAIQRLVNKGLIPSNRTELLSQQLKSIVQNESVMDWFSGEWAARNEAEIIVSGGKVLRPDRVMTRKNEAAIIDYKTGQPHARHHKQVSEYVDALREMGYAPVKGYVYYLNLGIVEEAG